MNNANSHENGSVSRNLTKSASMAAVMFIANVSFSVLAQVSSYSDVPADTPVTRELTPSLPPSAAAGGLFFFTDQASFEAVAPGLPVEDFSGSLVPSNSVCSNNPPLNNGTNDGCFPAGGVMNGFSLEIIPNGGTGQYVLLTTGFFGTPFNVVGPNSFPEHMDLLFSPPVTAVGFDIVGDLIIPVNVDLEIFASDGSSLGTATANGSIAGNFWGVNSTSPIGRIAFRENSEGGELIGNLQYGIAVSIPTLGEAALIGFVVLLMTTGLFMMRRRRKALG